MTSTKSKAKRCPKCDNPMSFEDGHWHCHVCGTVRYSRIERHRFFETNKEDILKDMSTLGRPETLTKWGIPQSSIISLLRRWGYRPSSPEPVQRREPQGDHHESPGPAPVAGVLPPLPAFSDTWAPTVQLAWLCLWREIYEERNDKRDLCRAK